MPFAYIIAQLTDGYAAKREVWGGYVKKTVTSTGYTLTWKNRAGTEYVYTYDSDTDTWTAPSTTVPFDADMMAAMIATDWITGKTTSFESARSGTGTW